MFTITTNKAMKKEQSSMNNKEGEATLFGFLNFNAFDETMHYNLLRFFGVVSIISFLILNFLAIYLSIFYLTDHIFGFFLIFIANALAIIILISLFNYFDNILLKINADSRLAELDPIPDHIKICIGENIKVNGFFTSQAYWVQKNEINRFNKIIEKQTKKIENENEIEDKYPLIFK